MPEKTIDELEAEIRLFFTNEYARSLFNLFIKKVKKEKDICNTCRFPKSMLRDIVILDNSILSYMNYEADKCPECGHQKSGWTIKVVKEHYEPIISKKNKEIKELRVKVKELLLELKEAEN